MNKKMKKQGLSVSLFELAKLKRNLVKQTQELQKELGIKNWEGVDSSQRFQVGIVNKTPVCSDTWEIE